MVNDNQFYKEVYLNQDDPDVADPSKQEVRETLEDYHNLLETTIDHVDEFPLGVFASVRIKV